MNNNQLNTLNTTGDISTIRQLFSIDLRSLALFRIGLAITIIADLIIRVCDLKAHYSDLGFLPRSVLLEHFANRMHISIHLISGLWQVQAILFLIAFLTAIALLMGYKTRLVTFLSWFFVVSVQLRNPMILYSADSILRMLLFWSIFLPLGAYYSVDSALNSSSEKPPKEHFSLSTVAILLQACFVYPISGILQKGSEWRSDYNALYYILSLEDLATPFGYSLLNYEELLKGLTRIIFYLEFLGWLILFSPIKTNTIRLVTTLSFICLQIGIGLCLYLDFYPLINIVSIIPFIPSLFWETVFKKVKTPERLGLKIYFRSHHEPCKKFISLLKTFFLIEETHIVGVQEDETTYQEMLSQHSLAVVDHMGNKYFNFKALAIICQNSPLLVHFIPLLKLDPIKAAGKDFYNLITNNPQTVSRITWWLPWKPLKLNVSQAENVLVSVFLVCFIVTNLAVVNSKCQLPEVFKPIFKTLAFELNLDMFIPSPPRDDGWYVVEGTLRDGQVVDVFRDGKPVTYFKPDFKSLHYKNYRWCKYLTHLRSYPNEILRLNYARSVCRKWNSAHSGSKQLETFNIYFMKENNLPNKQNSEAEKLNLWLHYCFNVPEKIPEDKIPKKL